MSVVKCQTIAGLLEEMAPKKLAESWDNVGLLIGDGKQPVKKIMVCLDVPEWVMEEAIENDVDLIVSHHPIIFSGLKRINTDTPLGKKIIKLIKNNISVYCLHTNYDFASGGLSDTLARQLGFEKFETISISQSEKLFKVVVYVPKGHDTAVMQAMSNAGAGHIGQYSSCFFRSEGIGTFKPEEGSNPFIGKPGKLEEVEELRLETIVKERLVSRVTKEMLKAHPYEEAAFDIIPLSNEGNCYGIGRLGILENATTLSFYAENVKHILDLPHIRVAGDPNMPVRKIAVANGSGDKFASQARFAGADVLVTGDLKYHEIIDAVEAGLGIIDAGHHATEKIMIKTVASFLREKCAALKYEVEVVESRTNIDPLAII